MLVFFCLILLPVSEQDIIIGLTKTNQPVNDWCRVAHKCVSKLTIIDLDNGLAPGRRQAIIWTNIGILSMGLLGPNLRQIVFEFQLFI